MAKAMITVEDILMRLKAQARPDQLEGMARYGMAVDKRLGISMPSLRKLAKDIGKDHNLAQELWKTEIAEARIVAAMIDDPAQVTEVQMEGWVKGINSWDVCDQVCMNLFEKTPLAWSKIIDWAERKEECVKRTAFSLIACLAWHDEKAGDDKFIALFPIIKLAAMDERNFVKKAVNWSLRNIGKRNRNLNRAAIDVSREIQKLGSRAARSIAGDTLKELESEAVQKRLKG
jgi:3-methyladenine DNA glycosylase AlkD